MTTHFLREKYIIMDDLGVGRKFQKNMLICMLLNLLSFVK